MSEPTPPPDGNAQSGPRSSLPPTSEQSIPNPLAHTEAHPSAEISGFSVWQTLESDSIGSGDERIKRLSRYISQYSLEIPPSDDSAAQSAAAGGGAAAAAESGKHSLPTAAKAPAERANRPAPRMARTRPIAPGYRILRHLGEGTYGSVWLAEEELTSVRVAIKFFAHGTDRQWQKLQDDMQMLARTDGAPGIVQLRTANPENDPPYYVISYAENGSLAQLLEKGPLPVAEALRLFTAMTRSMAYVHAKGIRHCDLKPGNVLLDARNEPLIADFGQAHLANDARPTLGTYFYMAPEQATLEAKIADSRWDVYGLGAVLYEMLTRDLPRFEGTLIDRLRRTTNLNSRLELYRQQITNSPRPRKHRQIPGVDRALANIIERCLEIDPEKRFREAGEVLAALQQREVMRRRRSLAYFGIGLSVLLIGIIGWVSVAVGSKLLDHTREELTRSLLESNQSTAKIAANGLEQIFQERVSTIEEFAKNDPVFRKRFAEMHEKMSAAKDRVPAEALTPEDRAFLGQWVHHHYHHAGGKSFFSSGLSLVMAIQDQAYIVARLTREGEIEPYQGNEAYYQRNWAWRDWFNGSGDQDNPDFRAFPIQSTHISQPYQSQASDGSMLITLSTPIRASEDGPILGLILSGINLTGFYQWIDSAFRAHGPGNTVRAAFPVVVNDRGQVLKHDRIRDVRDMDDPQWLLRPQDWNQPRTRERIPDYQDPLDPEHAYLAGVARFQPAPDDLGYQDWMVIVQTQQETALAPLRELRNTLISAGWFLLGIVGVLLGGVWWWLFRLMRQTEPEASSR
ncbi:serine/threonine protein kinase [Tuwongella immobilis]|uniref:Protein kinase domain-containing protein n=1 Tax=Tuwongella immobilis TaxID=692036 RepID=A0A6C2YX67_9BACT|nr:serine/threonine-protein kinase [Tuwongella immobilis]VIP05723.1 serine threonine protein kinase : Serine/threonine protein kinase OS=Singulisphaera acidiphila (strain ATCC BAA-1392 / DSM 18658 / VKM B-2454 / MOB10) GN=Sinac_4916 PE=3 SV=1: Pkinase [Tuwongella immobilis]VTS08802.1 serine threonine protein kinase : Serine/threonine protein kinase OS=Singulisphaera acidiphila (strain ATCC BAA-1392 / DSM 18658 / VKM B-2454 / MOB10) GN=Sinac_4916 PE=3 SV=1: Pkinase [Tuwongella immobilis]